MKKFNQYIIEKLKLTKDSNLSPYRGDWEDFCKAMDEYTVNLYFDELGLELKTYTLPNGRQVDPTYLAGYDENTVVMSYYDPITDDDEFVDMEDFLDIERLFKDDDCIEKIWDYITK
jgi:hypothetical protein